MKKKIGISAIICTYNGAERLQPTLQHLLNQKNVFFEWEIILINNASTDNTVAIAQHILKNQNPQNIPYRIETEPNPGVGNARQLGFKIANFEYICFIDDDNWLNINYLRNAFDIMQHHPQVAVCGGYGIAIASNTAVLPTWFTKFERAYGCGKQHAQEGFIPDSKMYVYFAGATLRFSSWEHLTAARFILNHTARSEDVEICHALRLAGYKIYYSPTLHFQHCMTPNRLTKLYLKQLFAELPLSAPTSRMYINAVLKGTPTSYPTAIFETFAGCLLFCAKSLFSLQFLEFQMFCIYFKNRFLFLIKNKKKYNQIKANILQLQQNLKQLLLQ